MTHEIHAHILFLMLFHFLQLYSITGFACISSQQRLGMAVLWNNHPMNEPLAWQSSRGGNLQKWKRCFFQFWQSPIFFGAGDAFSHLLGEQNVTLAVNICFDIGASFDPKNIEGNSGEWYYGKIVSNQSNSWCDNYIGTWKYKRYRFAKLQGAHPPFAYLADNPWQMAPKSHWQQDCQETINHPPKVWAAKIIWYTAVWIQWWSVKPIELWPLASVFVERPCKWVIFHNLWASSGCEPVTCNLVFVFYVSLCWRWSNSSIAPTRAISMH